MSHGYVAPGYVEPGYVADTGQATSGQTVLGGRVNFKKSSIRSQVFLTVGPEREEVVYQFSNGRTFKEMA